MASLVAKRPRMAIQNSQRKALRAWYCDPTTTLGAKKTLADASTWWNSQYGYSISASTASEILSSKYAHLDADISKVHDQVKKKRLAKWQVLEDALSEWAFQFDIVHGTVSGDLLRLKATELWGRLSEYQGQPCPSWSEGWLTGFKSRHNFHRRRKVGEAASVEITADITAQMEVIYTLKAGYLSKDTYNMDETGFCWKKLPNSGLTTSSKGLKLDKTRITVNLCCNEDGSDKVPLWFIGKAQRPHCFSQNRISNPENLGIFWRWNSSAWMTHLIMIDWLKWFDQRAGRPVLLLMDNFSAHQLALELIEESSRPLKWTRIEWFPANTTCLYQPLDQGIIQNWKCFVKRELLFFLKDEFDSGRDYTQTHHVLRAIRWGILAWERVELSTIINCWRKGMEVSNKPVDSWSESLIILGEIDETVQSLPQIEELKDIRTFIDPIEERIVDSSDELTNQIVARYNNIVEEEQEESSDKVTQISVFEAITALNTLKLYEEQRIEPVNQDLMSHLRRELRDLESRRANLTVQSTLEGWLNRGA